MCLRIDIVKEARGWLDTPFRAKGRLKGFRADCPGPVIGVYNVLKDHNEPTFVYDVYPDQPTDSTMIEICDVHLVRISWPEVKMGDVLVLASPNIPCHMGIVGDYNGELTLIHAYAPSKKVIEHRIDDHWRSLVRACYRYPFTED